MVTMFVEKEMLESAVKKRDKFITKRNEIIAKTQEKLAPIDEDIAKAQAVVDIYAPRDEKGQPVQIPYTAPVIATSKAELTPSSPESHIVPESQNIPEAQNIEAAESNISEADMPAFLNKAPSEPGQ